MHHVVVLGGSFDPVHLGHIAMASAARTAFPEALILWVPAGHAPHKLKEKPTRSEDRAHLLELVISGRQGEQLSRLEVDRPGPSFMVDTLKALHAELGKARKTLLLGADSLLHLASWSRLPQLFALADFAFVPRPGFGAATLDDFSNTLEMPLKRLFQAQMLDMSEVAISSTEIRQRLQQGLSIEGFVPAAVAEAIYARQLYLPT